MEGTPDDIMEACFDDMLGGHGEGAGWRLGAEGVLRASRSAGGEITLAPAARELFIKDAVLWGGNLAVLTSLLGTPYLAEVKGGILFLEDVHEHPYRVERMLTQLLHAGVLARQKAVVLGQFTNQKAVPHDKGFKQATVVQWLRMQLPKTPVLTNLPFGHVPTKVCLPVGAKVSFTAEGRDALLFWGHLH